MQIQCCTNHLHSTVMSNSVHFVFFCFLTHVVYIVCLSLVVRASFLKVVVLVFSPVTREDYH